MGQKRIEYLKAELVQLKKKHLKERMLAKEYLAGQAAEGQRRMTMYYEKLLEMYNCDS